MGNECLYAYIDEVEEEIDLDQRKQWRLRAAERRRGRQTGAFIALAYGATLTTAIALAIHLAHAWGWR